MSTATTQPTRRFVVWSKKDRTTRTIHTPLTDEQALEVLKTKLKWSKFATDLATKWQGPTGLSPRQLAWAHVLAYDAVNEPRHKVTPPAGWVEQPDGTFKSTCGRWEARYVGPPVGANGAPEPENGAARAPAAPKPVSGSQAPKNGHAGTPLIDADLLTWNGKKKTFSATASDLKWGVGQWPKEVLVQSPRTGQTQLFKFAQEHTDPDGDDLCCVEYRWEGLTLFVYND